MPKPALPTLIRLAEQAVEKVQRDLADNQNAQSTVRAQIVSWQQEASAAFAEALTHDSATELQAAGLFQGRARSEVAKLEEQLQALQHHHQELLQALQLAYAKQQRYEILAEQQAQAAKREANRKAQAQLDDLRRATKVIARTLLDLLA